MHSGGQTSQVGKEKLTPEQVQLLESMAALDEEMSKAIRCESVGRDEDGNVKDPDMVGSSCVASTEQYEDLKNTFFKDAQCNPLPGEQGYSCFIPESNKATENSAKRFKQEGAEKEGWGDGEWGLFTGFGAGIAVGGAVIMGLGCLPLGAVMLVAGGGSAIYGALQMGDEPSEGDVEEGKGASADEKTADAKEKPKAADKGEKADEKSDKQSFEGKLVIDIEGTSKDLEWVSETTDIKYQLEQESEQYKKKEVTADVKKEMQLFASDTAKQVADNGERVTWNMDEFETAYGVHAQMKSNGWEVKDVKQSLFNSVGWVTVSFDFDRQQKRVNVFTGKEEMIKTESSDKKEEAPGNKKDETQGSKKGATGTGKVKTGGGSKKGGGAKKGSKKKAASGWEGF